MTTVELLDKTEIWVRGATVADADLPASWVGFIDFQATKCSAGDVRVPTRAVCRSDTPKISTKR